MKVFISIAIAASALAACNSNDSKPVIAGPKSTADSLEVEIEKAHVSGMGKMGKLTRYHQYTESLIDSISKLPSASVEALAKYNAELVTLSGELSYAETAMDKWMYEFNPDSLASDEKAHTAYLKNEQIKAANMVNAINSSIAKGDSLLPIARPAITN